MTLRGQRFSIDEWDEQNSGGAEPDAPPVNAFDFVTDVKERTTHAPQPPKAPTPRTSGGFPAHRKRDVQSKFKRSRQQDASSNVAPTVRSQQQPSQINAQAMGGGGVDNFMASEKQRIDEENKHTLASMSQEELIRERDELLRALDPSLVHRLLQRATIEDGGSDADFPGLEKHDQDATSQKKAEPKVEKTRKSVKFAEPEDAPAIQIEDQAVVGQQPRVGKGHVGDNSNAGEVDSDADEPGKHAARKVALPADSSIHFPRAPQPPPLDPSSPNFLNDLHEKYFPDLPQDPEKLEWMSSTPSKTYSPSQSSLAPKDIRFGFTGALIPPSLAAQIPVTAGLHHHGDAPDAAGYTIPELAMLARSSVAAQRCVAFQTLGRILYRLGRGEFGDAGDENQDTVGAEESLGELARALWSEVDKEGVIEICVAESEGRGVAGGRHLSAKAYATEAVWLWQKGGGRRWKSG